MAPIRVRLPRTGVACLAALPALAAGAAVARADPDAGAAASAQLGPALDDFFERTRAREDDFAACPDCARVARLVAGAVSATPTTPGGARLATGARLGVALATRGGAHDSARATLWADVLRVHHDGSWMSDLGARVTVFHAWGRPRDDGGLHLSVDAVAGRRTELRLMEVARLQRDPYRLVDAELELAPIGPRIDKDGNLALPVGVAHRARAPIGGGATRLDQRLAVSGAIAFRGFPKHRRTHAQLDFARVKQTWWQVPGGAARATTLSAGYQRLPTGIDTLPLWALVGYQWARTTDVLAPSPGMMSRPADGRGAFVAQLGMDLPLAVGDRSTLSLAPAFERALELDPRDAAFRHVTAARVGLGLERPLSANVHLRAALTYEAALVEGDQRVHTLTPALTLSLRGFDVGLQHRLVLASAGADPGADPAMATRAPRSRFQLGVDRRF